MRPVSGRPGQKLPSQAAESGGLARPPRAPDETEAAAAARARATGTASGSTLASGGARPDESRDRTDGARPAGAGAPVLAPSSEQPAWAGAGYFQEVAARAARGEKPAAGKPLAVRLGAAGLDAGADAAADRARAARVRKGLGLLRRVAVAGGKPLSAEDVAQLKTSVHLTPKDNVPSILQEGLRPTTKPFANWSTWMKHAVYMFEAPPKKGGIEDRVVRAQGMTEVIEIDLTKLDPDKLYKRVIDGALVFLTSEPIPPEALRHRGSLA